MYRAEIKTDIYQKAGLPEFRQFRLQDRALFQRYIKRFNPVSAEYNFANLFSWQEPCQLSWCIYQDRILIYDALQKTLYRPLGKDFTTHELVCLSLQMQAAGLSPNLDLFTKQDLAQQQFLDQYYTIKEKRDNAEYIYDVNALAELNGSKLHKKRNLISQFERLYPDYQIHEMRGEYRQGALELAGLINRRKHLSKGLRDEFAAIKTAVGSFDQLGFEGLVIIVNGNIVAFSMFSRLNVTAFDIHFEKSDTVYKGASQLINRETARYLRDRCLYLNREQDLGIKGLRQAKLSYEPKELFLPHTLTYTPVN